MQGISPVVNQDIVIPIDLLVPINLSSDAFVPNLQFPPTNDATADVDSIYHHLSAISLAPDKDFYEINEMDPKDPRVFVKETKSKVTNETSKEIEIDIKFDNVEPLLKYNRNIRFRITSELMKEGNVLPDATANHQGTPEKVIDVNSMLSSITVSLKVDALEKQNKKKCNVRLQITSLVDGRDAGVNTFITPHFYCYSDRTKRRLENTNSISSGTNSSNSVNDVEGTATSDLSFNQNLQEETVSNSETSSCSGKRLAVTEIDTQRASKRSAIETEFILHPSHALSFIRQLEPESIAMRLLFSMFWEKHCMKPSEWSMEQLKDTLCEFVNYGGIRVDQAFLNNDGLTNEFPIHQFADRHDESVDGKTYKLLCALESSNPGNLKAALRKFCGKFTPIHTAGFERSNAFLRFVTDYYPELLMIKNTKDSGNVLHSTCATRNNMEGTRYILENVNHEIAKGLLEMENEFGSRPIEMARFQMNKEEKNLAKCKEDEKDWASRMLKSRQDLYDYLKQKHEELGISVFRS